MKGIQGSIAIINIGSIRKSMRATIQTGFMVNGGPCYLILGAGCQGGSNPKGETMFPSIDESLQELSSFDCRWQISNAGGSIISLAGMIMIRFLNAITDIVFDGNHTTRSSKSRTLSRYIQIDDHIARRRFSLGFGVTYGLSAGGAF